MLLVRAAPTPPPGKAGLPEAHCVQSPGAGMLCGPGLSGSKVSTLIQL